MAPVTDVPTVWNSLAEAMYMKGSSTAEVKVSKFSPFSFARLRSSSGHPEVARPLVGQDGFLVVLQLKTIPFLEQFFGKKKVSSGTYPIGAVSAVNLEEQPACLIPCSFDALLLNITQAKIDEFSYAHRIPRVRKLNWPLGAVDLVITHLGQSLVAALESPNDTSKLFVDHVLQSINCHLVWSYGDAAKSTPIVRRGLAPWQVRRSTEILAAHLDGNIALQELADSCGLSLGHFARAFKITFGKPPHKWLVERRLDKAKDLIVNSHLSLSEIAAHCGFADQSALSRTFKRTYRTGPGIWRRGTTDDHVVRWRK